MFTRILIFALALGMATSTSAGPWLRERGTTFTAASVTSTYYLDTASQSYTEHGLTETITLVTDIGASRSRHNLMSGYATISMRRALSASDAKSKWAYEVGVGSAWVNDRFLPHVRTGLSWGRGMTWGKKSGWMTVEGAVIWDMTHQLHVSKVDTTVGINFTASTTGMLQVFTANVARQNIASIAPSLVFKPKITKFKIQIGSDSEIGNLSNTALKIGIWREF